MDFFETYLDLGAASSQRAHTVAKSLQSGFGLMAYFAGSILVRPVTNSGQTKMITTSACDNSISSQTYELLAFSTTISKLQKANLG